MISKTSFWEQWVVRENDKGQYELAFGHHRLEAAKQLYGGNYEVSVQVEDYTDEQMLVALADENAGSEESVEVQVDVVRIARQFLKNHPEACKFTPSLQRRGANRTEAQRAADVKNALDNHIHGSEPCLLAFLGEVNWNDTKIHNLLSIADRFDAALLKDVANAASDGHPERKATVGITAAVEIAKLERPAQTVVVKALKEANKELSTFQKAEMQERTKRNLPRNAVKDMSVHIPAAIVKQAVKKAANLPADKQATAVVQHIKQEVKHRKEYAITASVPDADKVVSKMVAQLFNFPADADMQELLANREFLSGISKKNLLTALDRNIERFTKYRDTLVSSPQKKLKP